MTDRLYKELVALFPPIRGRERVHVYGAMERLHLDLLARAFVHKPEITSHKGIEKLARRTFDVPFAYERRGDTGPAVFFEPNKDTPYQLRHSQHHIEVKLPNAHPVIDISTGNRGAVELVDEQRRRYLEFVRKINELFVRNARQ